MVFTKHFSYQITKLFFISSKVKTFLLVFKFFALNIKVFLKVQIGFFSVKNIFYNGNFTWSWSREEMYLSNFCPSSTESLGWTLCLFITRQIWGIWKLRPAYSPETPNLGQNRWCLVPCDLEIWWMTLENNRAPLLCCFKLCATFHSHRWIQTGVAVRKSPIWVKFDDF